MDQTNDRQGMIERSEGRNNRTPAESVGGQILICPDGSLNLQVRLECGGGQPARAASGPLPAQG